MYKHISSLLLLTLNVPLQISKCTPRGTCTPVWEYLVYDIGSQSAPPYGAPGLRERNLGAPRAIRLIIKILTWLILQLSKEAITAKNN